jgi:hypothetical protein
MRSCLCLEIGQAVLAKYDAALLDIDHLNSTARPAFIFDILILQIANMSADREQWERALADAGTRENQLMLDKASLQKVLLFSLIWLIAQKLEDANGALERSEEALKDLHDRQHRQIDTLVKSPSKQLSRSDSDLSIRVRSFGWLWLL